MQSDEDIKNMQEQIDSEPSSPMMGQDGQSMQPDQQPQDAGDQGLPQDDQEQPEQDQPTGGGPVRTQVVHGKTKTFTRKVPERLPDNF
jgi:hypothetical protein